MLPAEPAAIGQLRRRAKRFATEAGASEEVVERVAFAVSETVTNAVLHAYADAPGEVSLRCRADGERLTVEVCDEGAGISTRADSPGIGHGLTIVGALAEKLQITSGCQGRGTRVTMGFGSAAPPDRQPGWEPLCALALETMADAACVDVVREGVLRRVAAEVASDPGLTAWLRAAMPPARPGTATWEAMREGGVRLVVHDPAATRSPGGIGERLGLTWWVAVSLQSSGQAASALWGFGGRAQGSPVPSEATIDVLKSAELEDLTQPAPRAMLRAQLALAAA